MARSIAERYKTRGHDGSRTKSATFYLLVDLMFFFDLFHQKQNEEALDVISLRNSLSKKHPLSTLKTFSKPSILIHILL